MSARIMKKTLIYLSFLTFFLFFMGISAISYGQSSTIKDNAQEIKKQNEDKDYDPNILARPDEVKKEGIFVDEKPKLLWAPDHPGNKTREEALEQVEKNKKESEKVAGKEEETGVEPER